MSSRSIGPVWAASSRSRKQRVVLSIILSLTVIATMFSMAPPASAAGFIKNPSSLDFGQVGVGTSSPTQVITLTNDNAVNMNVTSVNLSGGSAHYSMLQDCTPSVAPDNSCEIAITFNPLSVGTKAAEVVVTHDQSPNPDVIGFTGDGVAGVFEAEPTNLNFGTLELSDTLTKKVSVDNKGPGNITVTHIDIFGDNANFGLTVGDCGGGVIPPFPFTLANGQGCTFEVAYSPASLGAHAASLRLITTDPNSPFNIPLAGSAIADPVANLSFSPDPLTYGGKGIGSSTNKILEVTNSGTAPANITNIAMSGGDAVFSVTDSCVGVLNPGATCNATVVFAPTTAAGAGNTSSQVRVISNAPGSPHLVDVSAEALAGNLVAAPASHDFGQLSTADPAISELIEITNTGPGTVDFAAITITGDDAAFAHPAGTCSAATVLANGASCTLGATFNPLVNGATTATGRITSDAANSPLEIVYKGEGIAPNVPGISVSPSPLAYGTKGVGSTSNEILTVTNTGNAPLNVTGVTMVGGDVAQFPLGANNCGPGIAPGGSCTITSTFVPTVLGDLASQVQIVSNAPGGNTLVDVSGTAAGPILDVAPATVDFGSQVVGTNTPATLITATNNGNAPLTFAGVPTLGGANPLQYTLSGNTCGASLAAGQSCSVMVQFTPNNVPLGNKTAQVEFASNAPGSPHIATLSGLSVIGKAADLSATELDFGTVNVGETSAPQTMSLTNTGSDNVTLPLASILFGGDVADFTVLTNGCTPLLVLPPGASCDAIIEFSPSAEGNRSTTYVGSSDAPGSPHLAMLKGVGAPAAAPVLELSPASIDYGSLPLGVESPAQVITATNTGTADLVFSAAPTLGGLNPLQFATGGDTCGTGTLAPGASCTILARFTPNAAIGAKDATLQFASNAAGSPHAVHLAGLATAGPAPIAALSVDSLDYGSQAVGIASAAKTIKVTNTGNADLIFSAVPALMGVDTGDFATSGDTCATSTLVPGASCSLQVQFNPTSVGNKVAQVEFYSNAAGSPHVALLSGIGIDEKLGLLSPADLDFSSAALGTKTASKQMMFTNIGTSDITIGTASIIDGDSGDFVLASDECSGATLAAGQSCLLDIWFAPTDTGARNSVIEVTSDAVGGPHRESLAGVGVVGKLLDVSPSTLDFLSAGIGSVTGAKSFTVTNVGSDDVTLGALTPAGFDSAEFMILDGTCAGNPVLEPGESCEGQVKFAPTGAAGARSATLEIASDALGAPHTITLMGNGTLSKVLEISPNSKTFGDLAVGLTSPAQAFTVTNVGSDPVTLASDAGIVGGDTSEFLQGVNTCLSGKVLNPGTSCTTLVAFAPTSNGDKASSLEVASDAPGSPNVAPLYGKGVTGPAATISPTPIDFGNVGLGVPSVAQVVTLTNTGTSGLNISSDAFLDGVDAAEFQLSANSCLGGAALPPGASCTVTVYVDPTSTGLKSASLVFENDAPGSPQQVPLFANVVNGAAVHLDPSSLDFADQGINTTSAPRVITLTNVGTQDLLLGSDALIVGPDAGQYVEGVNTCLGGSTIVPLGTCSFTVQFSPTTAGPKTAAVQFENNAPGSPQTVPLTGNGTAGLLTLLPSSLVTFGNQGVGTVSATRTVTLKNLGAAPVSLGAVAPTLSGFDAGEFEMGVNTCTANLVLDPTEGCSMMFRFVPTSIGAKSAAVVLDHDALDAPALLLLSGIGVEGVIADLAPTSLNFGNQGTGTQSAGKTVKITNFGPAPLNFNVAPTIAGLDAAHYKIVTDACPPTLNPGGSCEVTVAFAPNVVGPLTAALQFDSDMLGTLKIVPLLGIGVIGPEMNFNVKRIDFNSHGLATPARTVGRTIRMRNTGLWPMTIPKAPKLVGKNTGSFRLHSNTCKPGMVLMPTKKCSVTVEFGPPLKGKKTAGVKFFSDASGAPAVILLRGQGERPQMVMNDYLHFSPRKVGERSFGKTVVIKNHGPSTLVIKEKPTIIGIDREDFLMTGRNCFRGTKIFPNGTCSFTIVFAPEEPGRLTASVLVRTNGPRTKRFVTLKGRGYGQPLDH